MAGFMVPNYFFSVIIGKSEPLPFHKVSGMEGRLEYDAHHEGGENSFAHILLKPVSSVGKLSLVRYLHAGGKDMELMVGEKISSVYVGIPQQNGKNDAETEGYSMMFTDCFVVGHQFSDLDSMGNQLMEETIEIAYQQMYYLPELKVAAT